MAAFSTPRGAMGMLFALFVILHAVVATQHNAHSHPVHRSSEAMDAHLLEHRDTLEKRANNIAIKGAGDNGVFPRLEIRELQKNADQWNLYLLALERFQGKSQNDRMSWFQIAGVHGRPFVSWNNQGPLLNQAGYCPHAQSLFGTWHRPYLAVFEQALVMNANEVISQFPANQQQKWRNALRGLRMPYYDWAMNPPSGQPAVPTSIRDRTVTVTKPNGRVSIPNPLYSYTFVGDSSRLMAGAPGNTRVTMRRPNNRSNPPGNNNDEMNVMFGQSRVGWRQRVFSLFASKSDWGRASTAQLGVRTSRRNQDSWESIHDEIHGTVGGSGGHMGWLDVAAFDPIFWLHHTNIDRLLAMHQLVVPNSYVARGNINRPMAQWQNGESKDANSPLKPFTKNTNGDYYNSVEVRETRTLGYFYPETQARTFSQVVSAINRLYGQGERAITKRSEGEEEGTMYPGRAFKEGDYDTVLSVVGDKFAMEGSYQVHCYLGNKPASNSTSNSTAPVTPDNSTAPVEPAQPSLANSTTPESNQTSNSGYGTGYVGSHTFLGGSMAGDAASPILVEGSIPITAALQGKEASGELQSLHPDHVEPYLLQNLHYTITGPDGSEIDPTTLPNFHVQVKACPVTPSSDNELPSFGDYIELPRARLPASQPWTYVPGPNDLPSDEPGQSPAPPSNANASMPWQEPGYCVSQQTIVYVDETGKKLYEEKH